ncbi:hypothetical protein [Microcoleus sp. N3A4]|uniref:hypothetical protein n=1 Tax=Microcoleus sp. N3A4 TaxID=3055379 RepID=UPI002FCEC910
MATVLHQPPNMLYLTTAGLLYCLFTTYMAGKTHRIACRGGFYEQYLILKNNLDKLAPIQPII